MTSDSDDVRDEVLDALVEMVAQFGCRADSKMPGKLTTGGLSVLEGVFPILVKHGQARWVEEEKL